MSHIKDFRDDLKNYIKDILESPDIPRRISGSGHRRITYALPLFQTPQYLGMRVTFQGTVLYGGYQSDLEELAFQRMYYIYLKIGNAKQLIATIQRKPKKRLSFKEKLYQPDEQLIANLIHQYAVEIAPDIKVEHEFDKPHKKKEEGAPSGTSRES